MNSGVTYDAGALVAAERNDRRMWSIHQRALARLIVPRIPAAVVTQVWRGGNQFYLNRLLVSCDVVALDRRRAELAGGLLAKGGDDAVDATVVEVARARGDAIVTSDRRDIERIADANGLRLAIVDV